ELQRRLHHGDVRAVALLRPQVLEARHHVDELARLREIALLERRVDRDRMLGPYVDEPGGEAARADGEERRRPGLGEPVDPDDVRIAAADRLGEARARGTRP